MPARQLSDGRPDGNVLGQSASDLIAFYGGTPSARLNFSTTLSLSVTIDASGNFVFKSSEAFNELLARINNIENKLHTLGLVTRA